MTHTTFERELRGLWLRLGPAKTAVLATSSAGRTTARTVSCILYSGKLYFQTDQKMTKARQIRENNRVALCMDNVQVEGTAHILGPPEQFLFFTALFERHFPNSFNAYTFLPDEVLVEVAPAFVTVWDYIGGKPYRDTIDLERRSASREEYQG